MKIEYPLHVVGNKIGDGNFIADFHNNVVIEFGDNLDLAEEVCGLLNKAHEQEFNNDYYDQNDYEGEE